MELRLKLYDANLVHPAKNCEVVAITEYRNQNRVKDINSITNLFYEDGFFNGKEHNMNDVVIAWAYKPKLSDIKKEDEF